MNQFIFKDNGDTRAVRVITIDNQPWWVLADLCAALNLGQPATVASRLDADEKGVGLTNTLGGTQSVTVVSESGMYSVILGARANDRTRAFKRWVTRDVLPTLRQTGTYTIPVAAPALPPPASDETTLMLQALLDTRRMVIDQGVIQTAFSNQLEMQRQTLEDMPVHGPQRRAIHEAGQAIARALGGNRKAFHTVWTTFNAHWCIAAYSDLPTRHYDAALQFLRDWRARASQTRTHRLGLGDAA